MAHNNEENIELPEDRVRKESMKILDSFRANLPKGSGTIKVEMRENAHKDVEKLFALVNELVGVVTAERCNNRLKEVEIYRLKNKNNEMERNKATPTAGINTTTGMSKPAKTFSYAAAAAAKPSFNIIVEPASKGKTTEETQKELKKAIDPSSNKLEIDRVRRGKNGGVIICCSKQEDVEKIKVAVANKTSLKSREETKSRPRVLFPRIEEDIGEREVINNLVDRTDAIQPHYNTVEKLKEDIKIQGFIKRRDTRFKDVVAEVTPNLRNILMMEPVRIGWQKVTVRDHMSILQCYKCHRIGHKAGACENELTCGKCGNTGHSFKECKSKTKCCALCKYENTRTKSTDNKVKTEHDSRATECPTMKRIKMAIIQKTDYHGQ